MLNSPAGRNLVSTHIWLMGVWTPGPKSRSIALESQELQNIYHRVLPGWTSDDVPGSPYAIADYHVSPTLGGDAGLKKFRDKLRTHKLKLLLDFVPNHMGPDFPWVTEKPDLFVQGHAGAPGVFLQQTKLGPRWLAQGKDPNFPAWNDTVQLDYRRPETRAAMTELMQSIARRCDGVRCDMAMLLLNDIFAKTWAQFPATGPTPPSEFWSDSIAAVKKAHPDFLFLAEAYWGLEPRLRSLGFDYTYDKTIYDLLTQRRFPDLQRYLLETPPEDLQHGAHFLENHDEPRIASLLSPAEERAAALLVLSLPGMRFLYEGQLDGRRVQLPVQLARRPGETPNEEILSSYGQMLNALKESAVGHGDWQLLRPGGWSDNQTAQNFFVIQWQNKPSEFELAVVNLSPNTCQCCVQPAVKGLASRNWRMRDRLGAESYERRGGDLAEHGLYLELPPHGAQLFQFQ